MAFLTQRAYLARVARRILEVRRDVDLDFRRDVGRSESARGSGTKRCSLRRESGELSAVRCNGAVDAGPELPNSLSGAGDGFRREHCSRCKQGVTPSLPRRGRVSKHSLPSPLWPRRGRALAGEAGVGFVRVYG